MSSPQSMLGMIIGFSILLLLVGFFTGNLTIDVGAVWRSYILPIFTAIGIFILLVALIFTIGYIKSKREEEKEIEELSKASSTLEKKIESVDGEESIRSETSGEEVESSSLDQDIPHQTGVAGLGNVRQRVENGGETG